ncbi:SDR family oxidoreductase [Endozoicomonadaceae bacterium StTr2]
MKNKNVLITGCSTGIGQALALTFNNKGYKVWATARNLEKLDNLTNIGIQTLELDVNDPVAIQTAAETIQQHDGQLDILVNNAGYGAMGPLIEVSEEELKQQFQTNVFAPMRVVQAFLLLLLKNQGTVVNIGSISGVLATPFSGAYCASKAAINTLSDVLRMELKPLGVNVVTVQPGAIQSNFGSTATESLSRLKPGSAYTAIESAIKERAMASQKNPTTAEEFADILVSKIESGKPLNIVRIGNGSRALPALKRWLPVGLLERILGRLFKLDRLRN